RRAMKICSQRACGPPIDRKSGSTGDARRVRGSGHARPSGVDKPPKSGPGGVRFHISALNCINAISRTPPLAPPNTATISHHVETIGYPPELVVSIDRIDEPRSRSSLRPEAGRSKIVVVYIVFHG